MNIKSGSPGDHGRGLALALGHRRRAQKDGSDDRSGKVATALAPPPAPDSRPAPKAETPVGPAAVVELGRPVPPAVTYAAPAPCLIVDVAEGARIQTNIHVKEQIAGEATPREPSRWTLGEGASLKINAHIDTLVGSGPGANIVLEDGASLTINQHIGTLKAGADGGTIVVGKDASLHLNVHLDSATTGGTIVVAGETKVHLAVHDHKTGPAPDQKPGPAPEPAAKKALEPALRLELPTPEKRTRKASQEDEDPLKDIKDLRWRLLRDVLQAMEKHRIEPTEQGKKHGKALGHLKASRPQG